MESCLPRPRKYRSRIRRPSIHHHRATPRRPARGSRRCCVRVFDEACEGSRMSWGKVARHDRDQRYNNRCRHRHRITRPCWWKWIRASAYRLHAIKSRYTCLWSRGRTWPTSGEAGNNRTWTVELRTSVGTFGRIPSTAPAESVSRSRGRVPLNVLTHRPSTEGADRTTSRTPLCPARTWRPPTWRTCCVAVYEEAPRGRINPCVGAFATRSRRRQRPSRI